MRATLFHPLAIALLAGSLVLAGTVRFLPGMGGWTGIGPWVVFWGLVGYTALVAALLWPRPKGSPVTDRQFSESDLSEASVKKALRVEALQHPATLVGLAVAVILVGYLALLAPGAGGGLAALAALVVAMEVAVGSFLWRYTFRYQQRYAAKMQWLTAMLDEARTRTEQAELERLRQTLQEGFPTVDAPRGVFALRALEEEFAKLRPLLDEGKETLPLSIMSLPALARDTYYQGLSVLADALELRKAIGEPDREQLETEIAELEREIQVSMDDESQLETNLIRQDTLASHRQRLAMLHQLRQLFQLANRCQASLQRTYIEIVAIRAGSSEDQVNSVVEALQETVRRAREVQEELHRLGY